MLRSGILAMGDDSLDDTSGEVMGVVMDEPPSDALLPEVMLPALELDDDRLRGAMSGAL